MKIYTSYYSQLNYLNDSFFERTFIVAISRFIPTYIDQNLIDEQFLPFAPSIDLLNDFKRTQNEKEYISVFNNELEKIDLKESLNYLIDKAEKSEKENILLLCYDAPEVFCHRHIISQKIDDLKILPTSVKELNFEFSNFHKNYKLPEFIDKIEGRKYLAITGHANIEKAFGATYKETYNKEVYDNVKSDIEKYLKSYMDENNIKDIKDIVFISGMARGVDEIFLDIAEENFCSIILAIPNSVKWHGKRNPRKDGTKAQAINYAKHLAYALNEPNSEIFEIRKNYLGKTYKYANFARNDFMVMNCDNMISYKVVESTGTDHAINSAKKHNKYFGNIPQYHKVLDIW